VKVKVNLYIVYCHDAMKWSLIRYCHRQSRRTAYRP